MRPKKRCQVIKTEPIEDFRPDDGNVGEAFECLTVRIKDEPLDGGGDQTIDVEESTTDDCVEVMAANVEKRRRRLTDRFKRLRKSRFEEVAVERTQDADSRHYLRETRCRLRDALAEIERLRRVQSELEQENARLIRERQVRTQSLPSPPIYTY